MLDVTKRSAKKMAYWKDSAVGASEPAATPRLELETDSVTADATTGTVLVAGADDGEEKTTNNGNRKKKASSGSRLTWDEHSKELVKFKDDVGNSNVPRSYRNLGIWVHNQRLNYQLFHNGEPSNGMTQEHIDQLNAVGFNWGKERVKTRVAWDDRFLQVQAFQRMYGLTRIPQT